MRLSAGQKVAAGVAGGLLVVGVGFGVGLATTHPARPQPVEVVSPAGASVATSSTTTVLAMTARAPSTTAATTATTVAATTTTAPVATTVTVRAATVAPTTTTDQTTTVAPTTTTTVPCLSGYKPGVGVVEVPCG